MIYNKKILINFQLENNKIINYYSKIVKKNYNNVQKKKNYYNKNYKNVYKIQNHK